MPTNKAKGIGVLSSPIYTFTVIFDPLGNFRKGLAHFGKKDFEQSLRDCVWPTGMILEGNDGITSEFFEVYKNKLVRMRIEDMPSEFQLHQTRVLA